MATLKTVVRERLTELFKTRQEAVINGVETFEEYRYQIGYLRGVYDAMAEALPLIERMDFDGDDEEGR